MPPTSRQRYRWLFPFCRNLQHQALSFYMMSHKSVKWWKKVFFYLLEICFCNSLIIWRGLHRGKRIDAEKFRLQIVHGLLQGQQGVMYRRGRLPIDPPRRLLVDGHYPSVNPKRKACGKPQSNDCVVCSDRKKKRHETQYMCSQCNVHLCPVPCFQRYHTLVDFKVDCSKELHK